MLEKCSGFAGVFFIGRRVSEEGFYKGRIRPAGKEWVNVLTIFDLLMNNEREL
jgi:hypothetical protein